MNQSTNILFPILSGDQVPANSKPFLDKVHKAFGFTPNLFAAFSNSPVLLEGYLALSVAFDKGTFTSTERQIILLAASVANDCLYCKAAHSTLLKGMLKVDPEIVSAVREGLPILEPKLDALVNLTREMVIERGHVSEETLEAFFDAGYRHEQVAEVLVGVALKTMSNYTNHLSTTELDAAFVAEK